MLNVPQAKALVANADVVSFDIFDTLIRRNVDSPRDVFNLMKSDAHDLSRGQVSNFRSVRVLAEKAALEKARERGVEEVTFDDIYCELQHLTGIDDSVRASIQALEVATELRCVSSRTIGRDLFEYAKMQRKQIILVSDMYLPRTAILQLLDQAGITNFGTLYLSNELMKTKREGDLFAHVLKELQVKPSQIVHIGDNPKGDVASPAEFGIATVHIPRSMVNFRELSEFGRQLAVSGAKHSSLTKSVVDAIIADRFFDTADRRLTESFFGNDPFQFGYVALGPLMLGLSFWLYREAKADRTEKLYFLSRDGLVMKRVFDELFPADRYGIETDYLHCSRRVVRVPLMKNKFDLLQPVSRPIHARTLGAWLESNYGISPEAIGGEVFERHGFRNSEEIITNSVNRDALSALVVELKDQLLAISTDERSALEKYLSHKRIGAGRHAVVDIGYAGTMQEALSSIIGRELKGYYLAVFGTSSGVKNQLDLKGFVSQYGADDNQALGICTHRFIYESLVCSSEDSVIRIKHADEVFAPVGREASTDQERKSFVDYAHAGAVALAREYRAASPIAPENSLLSPEASTLIFDMYLRGPMPKDVALLYGMSFEDLYGVTRTRYLAAEPSLLKSQVIESGQIIWQESLRVKQSVDTLTAKGAEAAGRKALANKEFVVAAESFLKAFEIMPGRPNYLRAAAEAYFMAGKRRLAVKKLEEFRRLNPKNQSARARQWVIRFPPLARLIGQNEFRLQ